MHPPPFSPEPGPQEPPASQGLPAYGSPPAPPPGNFAGPGPYPPPAPGWFAAPGQNPLPPLPRRRTGLLIGVVAAVVLVVGGGITWLLLSKNSKDTDTAEGAANALVAALNDRDVDAWNDLTCDTMHVTVAEMGELDEKAHPTASVASVETFNETGATATLTLTDGTKTETETFEMTKDERGWTACTADDVHTEKGG